MQAQMQAQQQQQQQLAQAAQVQELAKSIEEAETDFAEDVPDYDAASEYLVKTTMEQMKARYPDLERDPQRLHSAVTWEMFNMAQQARSAGRNPAEVYYASAKAMGFALAPPAPPAPPPSDPLAGIRAGQAAARGVGAAGGGASPPAGKVGIPDLLNLNGAAFSSATQAFLKEMRRG